MDSDKHPQITNQLMIIRTSIHKLSPLTEANKVWNIRKKKRINPKVNTMSSENISIGNSLTYYMSKINSDKTAIS